MGQLGDLSPQGSVAVGIFVGLLSTSIQSIGLTLQRKSHILEDEKDSQEVHRPPYRRRRWQIGMLMFVVSNIVGSTIQITTLPLPVLSTLQASGLVFNSVCATLILGEPFTKWSLGGTMLVSAGAVLIAIFGAIGEPAHSLDQLLELLGRRQFVAWMICQAILVVAIIAGAKAIKILRPRNSNTPRMRLLRGMAYGGISGILSAHSLLVAKSAVELLVRTIVDHVNQFNRWQSWVILLGLIFLALTQLYYLHRGLKLCSTSILYPFCFCVYNIIAILDGLIYFHQTSRLSLTSALLIALGTVILLAGVLALSWRLSDPRSPQTLLAKTPLTPGMGFLSDSTDSSPSSPTLSSTIDDEESRLLARKSLPNFNSTANGRQHHVSYHALHSNTSTPSPTRFRTPTMRNNDLLSGTRRNRAFTATEANDVWADLLDNTPSPIHHYRQSSARSTPSKLDRPAFRPRPASAALTESDIPSSTLRAEQENTSTEDPPSTTGKRASSFGRTYRDGNCGDIRRNSMPIIGGDGNHDRQRQRSRSGKGQQPKQPQEALGGWWKMKWWRDGKDKAESKTGGRESVGTE